MSVASRIAPILRFAKLFPPWDMLRVTMPQRAIEMMAAYTLLHREEPEAVDAPDARDPEFVKAAVEALRPIAELYFRWDVRGIENVPASGPALLVGSHNGAMLVTDTYMTMLAIADRFGIDRALHPLAHDFVFDDPILRKYALKYGSIRAGHRAAHRSFAKGDLVLVYPGSEIDTFRPFRERDRIELGGRTGFVKLALREGVPIVPVVSAGTHEQLVILTRGEGLARLFALKALARTSALPIALAAPWGITIAYLPYLPLPAQTTVAFGAPARFPYPPSAAEDPVIVEWCYADVVFRMQALLDEISRGRRPFLGQPRTMRGPQRVPKWDGVSGGRRAARPSGTSPAEASPPA